MKNYEVDKMLNDVVQIGMRCKFTEDELEALKIVYYFYFTVREQLPGYVIKLPNAKDPRKSYMFKHGYKAYQKIRDKLKPSQYELYARSQVEILKSIKNSKTGEQLALIDYDCLSSDKSWRRWLAWNHLLQKQNASSTLTEAGIDIYDEVKVMASLMKTKRFLKKKLGDLTKDNIIQAIKNRAMARWFATRQICGYYLLLSPIFKNENTLDVDLSFYKPGINAEVEDYFKSEFDFEF